MYAAPKPKISQRIQRSALTRHRDVPHGLTRLVAQPGGDHQRRAAVHIGQLRIGAELGQRLHHFVVAGARGEHKYTAEEFGITDDMIRTEFAQYYDHYAKFCAPVV